LLNQSLLVALPFPSHLYASLRFSSLYSIKNK
jgi:hypothetical protein